ncbi:hypothetical protein M3I54_27795 [Paraburkholderia sp. CNPSo 3274]|nr:hypothetical protein [Paraburkholderia sp. CNPSo 3274]
MDTADVYHAGCSDEIVDRAIERVKRT